LPRHVYPVDTFDALIPVSSNGFGEEGERKLLLHPLRYKSVKNPSFRGFTSPSSINF
jgi:hypothetical protein